MTTPPLPAHPSIGKYRFMPPSDLKVWQLRLLSLPSHLPDPCLHEGTPVLGREGPNCQFLVNIAIWQRLWWSSSRWWSCWCPLQRRKFLWPLCPPMGWRSAHPGQAEPTLQRTPITATAIDRSYWVLPKGVPVSGPLAKTDPLPLRRQMHSCCFFPGEDAATVPPQAPMSSTWVCRNHPSPCRERS